MTMNMREGEEVWPDIKSIIHCINLHGDNLVGAEIGVHLGQSFLTLLQTCPNISKLYGVDPMFHM